MGMFGTSYNPESAEISNVSFSIMVHLGYKDRGVGARAGITSLPGIMYKQSVIETNNEDI